MSFQATVFNVMIASPGDVQDERNIVRDVVHEWNIVNASTRRTVLLPVGWETHSTPLIGHRPQSIINWQVLNDSDLLIAAFWTRLGTPTGKSASGTVEEIEEHVRSGKPALIYFSASPVVPGSLDQDQYQALRDFKADCQKRGLYYSYDSVTEFRDKVRQHLALTLNTHPYFEETRRASAAEPGLPAPKAGLTAPSLSSEAQQLLLEAVDGAGGITVHETSGGSSVQANQKNFVEANNSRSLATWQSAVQELVDRGLVQPLGHKGDDFRVSRQGYEHADLLRS